MLASKHTIYLTKNHTLNNAGCVNVFMFNENGARIRSQWVKKNIEQNDGCFIVLDHKKSILNEVERNLNKRNYYIESINFSNMEDSISVNPFDLVKDTSEIHFMFLNFLYAMWDNSDQDITAMSNLIDAFASCVFFMFEKQRDKMTMETLRKMVYSVRATCQTENGMVSLSDAIFAGIKDQDSMPCKYYAQFKKAAGDRSMEVAEKVAQVFDMLTESDLKMMAQTDESLKHSFNFKTAVFVNVSGEEEEHSAKLLIILLNYFIQRVEEHAPVMVVIDDLVASNTFISLPHWMKEAPEHNMSFIVINDDLSEFTANPRAEKYFRNIQKVVEASVLVHHNDIEIKYAETLPSNADEMNELTNNECLATVVVPSKEISDQDELL